MFSLFAGIDKDGNTRFVADVERGLDCGCFCEACGSPLVAKRGEINEWHFAHEASQERPDCIAGAMNLLRRVAIEHLQARETLVLPAYREVVVAEAAAPKSSETVEWASQPVVVRDWDPCPAKHAPAARLELDNGAQVDLHVAVGDWRRKQSQSESSGVGNIGKIIFWVPVPQPGQLRAMEDAQRHIVDTGLFVWVHQSDVLGLVAQARQRLNDRTRALERVARETPSLRALGAGQRWAATKREMDRARYEQERAEPVPATPDDVAVIDESRWAAWRKPGTTFMFYGLKDGSGWLMVQHQDSRLILLPWPHVTDGWDEVLPARVGVPDQELQGLVLADPVNPFLYLRTVVKTTRITSDLSELAAIRWPE
ncbi:MAG: competence protein CoiA family protein [Devosia sp.]